MQQAIACSMWSWSGWSSGPGHGMASGPPGTVLRGAGRRARDRAHRAQPVGLAHAVYPGPVRRLAGDAVSRPGRHLPDHPLAEAIGPEQLEPYDSVQLWCGLVSSAQRVEDGFRVHVEGAGAVAARRLLLALGVVDDLPAIEGLRERWGHGVFHCPYCHRWEMRDRPLAVLGNGTDAVHLARLATGEGQEVSAVVLEGGVALPRAGVLVRPPIRQRSDLPAALGCALTEYGVVRTDEDGRTTVPGVFAVGDCASRMQQVALAVGQAARAAIVLNNELMLEATA